MGMWYGCGWRGSSARERELCVRAFGFELFILLMYFLLDDARIGGCDGWVHNIL